MKSPTVILSAARTPLGAFQGTLASQSAAQLGAVAVTGALARAGVGVDAVTDLILGQVLSAGQGQAPVRQAALKAGLLPSTRTVSINHVCGSGLHAVLHASLLIASDQAGVCVAGGTESMSQAPYLLPKARDGYRLGHQTVVDSLISEGLWDPHHNLHMGSCAEQCATRYGLTREVQDAYAAESFRRAQRAQADGRFAEEICPVELTDAKRQITKVEHDEGPGRVKFDRMATLKPAFAPEGTITAANASSLNDGAAALVLADEAWAQSRHLKAVARVVAFGRAALDPLWFTTAPVPAAREALARAGWSVGQVDLWEVNEAFAVVPLAFARELDVPLERLNVRGGAIALGHPLGCSGARVVVTLLAALRERGLRRGVAALCIGGGEGIAVCIELL